MRKIFIAFLFVAALAACSKNNSSAPDSQGPALAPDKAVLIAPASNSTCIVGRVLSATNTAVTLSWNTAANADSYDVVIKNLFTNVSSTTTTSAKQLETTFLRNTPYSWYVVSKSSKNPTTAKSDTWKFYNAGVAISSYAPFPSDLLLPTNEQNITPTAGKITLDWNGADVDNDITGYDVYFGTSLTNLTVLKANQVESILTDVVVTVGTTYYWKIIAKDSKGNTSASDIYSFKAI